MVDIGVDTVDFKFWNEVDKDLFLSRDRPNPARRAAVELMQKHMPEARLYTLVEVGCGLGFDYGDHFSCINQLQYEGFDGSAGMIATCRKHWPDAQFNIGGFEQLAGRSWDFVYSKAVLEHQPDFVEPLRLMLQATKLACIINWYLPPVDTGHYRQYNDAINVHYNKYNRSAVLDCVKAAHFRCEERAIAGSPNVLYYCRPA